MHLENESYGYDHGQCLNDSPDMGGEPDVLVYFRIHFPLCELKTGGTAFRAPTQRWLETCEKDKEAEEANKTHDSNRCDPLLDQWKCSIGLLREDFMYVCKENDKSC